MYPKSFIQRLRDEFPVSQIVGARVPLKKKGREFEACCPFHQEKSPSFFVNDQKGFYHCFGCSEHGDSIKFIMEYDKLSYPQAIESLAREVGIPLPEISPEAEAQEQKRQSLTTVVALAADWFQQQLQLAHGQAARDYLMGRGLSDETIKHFKLGYAPNDRNALKEYLLSQNAKESQLIETGLLIQLEDRSRPSYDRFRGRIMFPITDRQGEVIAFGGRLMAKSDTAPKYLNSPETPLFHKGHVLYNWKNAKMAARDDTPIIIAEGYMDVIALHQYGFTTGVAPLGTALTEMHLKGLWRYQDAPILSLDGDAAGQRAMWRSAELALPMLEPGKTLRFLTLPQGQDPDDFLQANGAKALHKKLEQTTPLSKMIFETVSKRHGTTTPEQRAASEDELNQMASRIQHESVQHHFKQYFREQRFAKGKSSGNFNKPYGKKQTIKAPPPKNIPTRAAGILRTQKQMLKLLIMHPELLDQGDISATLERFEISDNTLKAIQHWLVEREEVPSAAVMALRDDNQVHLPTENLPQAWQQLVDGVTLAQIDQEMQLLQREVTENSLQQLQALQAEKEVLLQRQYA